MADKTLFTLADAPLPACCAKPGHVVDSSARLCTCNKCGTVHTLDTAQGWVAQPAKK
jgi:hypothetical protein